MDSTKLDRRVTLQRASYAQNDLGEMVPTWATLATVWASRRDVSDGERVAAAEVSAIISTRFQIRYDTAWADLNPKDRLSHEGRIYEIVAVKMLGRRDGLEITAAARAD